MAVVGPVAVTEATDAIVVARPRRRRARFATDTADPDGRLLWAKKWKGIASERQPNDCSAFDRTVRGMLNRISTRNAMRLLPLDLCFGNASDRDLCGQTLVFPPWWAARFSALMLRSYLEVIRTNRAARSLATRSADNVLPEYLDAVSPLLERSPQLVSGLLSWFAHLLSWEDMNWATSRLLWLASKDPRCRDADLCSQMPPHALCQLPPELIRGRILSFLRPAPMPAVETLLDDNGISAISDGIQQPGCFMDWVAVLTHFTAFSPLSLWSQILSFSFSLANVALSVNACDETGPGVRDVPDFESRIFLAASLLATISHRLPATISFTDTATSGASRHIRDNFGLLSQLSNALRYRISHLTVPLSGLVASRVEVALQHCSSIEDHSMSSS